MSTLDQTLTHVSAVVPLYHSAATLPGCLQCLARQSFADFEVILIDSSPTEECAAIARQWAGNGTRLSLRYERSPRRLLPQEARNRGVALARGRLLVFTDPDIYPEPDWLERLIAAHQATGHPVVGGLACEGEGWLDQGVHLCKFSKWLPAGVPRPVDMGPTASLLCPRELFVAAGGFSGDMMMGDTTLSWELRRRGSTLWFEPRARAAHHHTHDLRSFLAERYRRGKLFGNLRLRWLASGRPTALAYFAVSALPVRLITNLWHVARHCRGAGQRRIFWRTVPVIALGFVASLAGESAAYGKCAVARSR